MNFLSHFYFDRQSKDPYLLFGIMLPDLWRGFAKVYNEKIRHDWPGKELAPFTAQSIEAGIHRHYELDKIFHNSALFHRYTAQLEQQIRSECRQVPGRLYFVAHIGFELLLDRYLLTIDAQVADDYFGLLQMVDETQVLNYFIARNISNGQADFLSKFNRLRKYEYLRGLAKKEDFVFALSRIYEMTSREPLNSVFVQYVLDKLPEWDRQMLEEKPGLFDQIN